MDSWQERLKQAKIQSALKCALGLSPKPIYFHKAIWTFTGSLPASRCHRSRRSNPNCERASPPVPLPGHFSPILCATSGPGDGWQGTPQRPATPWREPPQNVLWPSDPQVVVTFFFFLLFSGSSGSHGCVFVGGEDREHWQAAQGCVQSSQESWTLSSYRQPMQPTVSFLHWFFFVFP